MSLCRELVRDLRKYFGVPVEYSDVERAIIHGLYTFQNRDAKGRLIWERKKVPNLLTNVGVALMMDSTLQTAVTVVGPFLGLIGGAGAPTIAAGDTMASHAGWLEAGTTNPPTFSGTRGTAAMNAAVAATRTKALTSPLTFSITGTGTVQGAFIVTGPSAVNTVLSTAGTLFSAGAFGTAQPVINGNTLSVSWQLTFGP